LNKILTRIYSHSQTISNPASKEFQAHAVLYKFFCDIKGKLLYDEFNEYVDIPGWLDDYIQKVTSEITTKITPPPNDLTEDIDFNEETLMIFMVLVWLDATHDDYCKNTLLRTLYDSTSFMNDPVVLFPNPIRYRMIRAFQTGRLPIPIQRMIEDGIVKMIEVQPNLFDYQVLTGFEKILKEKIFDILGHHSTDVLEVPNTNKLFSSTKAFRINYTLDQGDGRIQESIGNIKVSNDSDNKLRIENAMTMGGLVDPGRFFHENLNVGYQSMFSGIFPRRWIDGQPHVNGKFALGNITFKFNLEGQSLFSVRCFPGRPAVSSRADENTDFMVLRINNTSKSYNFAWGI
jgi:hypothetical protein